MGTGKIWHSLKFLKDMKTGILWNVLTGIGQFKMNKIIVLTSALFLSGCVTCGSELACSDVDIIALRPDVVRIDAKTEINGNSDIAQVHGQILQKAARETIKRGYTHFIINDDQQCAANVVVGIRKKTHGTVHTDSHGNSTFDADSYTTNDVRTINTTSTTIKMFSKGQKIPAKAYDAAHILGLDIKK